MNGFYIITDYGKKYYVEHEAHNIWVAMRDILSGEDEIAVRDNKGRHGMVSPEHISAVFWDGDE